ncbi:MAG: aquaporin family protein [Rhodospirillaceae bacterium]|jgi:glycerol uptake facilitator-like aquaporin|nr:aquaporin family protein [Rhodospirillaceae bacterium]
MSNFYRSLVSEWLGTMFLLATVIGSGIMAENLAAGNMAIALLGNTIPTGAILVVLITILGPISGAHLNPAVTIAFLLRGEILPKLALAYIVVQIIGAICGALLAHFMFELPLFQESEKLRTGLAQWGSEFVATFGLLATIFGTLRWQANAVPIMVGLYITAAYWFTASTSFANPAVTIARSFTNTFSGIFPEHAFGFIVAQLSAAVIGTYVLHWLFAKTR